ncbi:hypothetical protein D3C85_1640740 [compost metagenome]
MGLFRAVGTGRVGPGRLEVLLPAVEDRVDPGPGRLDLVTAHEQRRVAFEHIQQQPLIGVPATGLAEHLGQVEVQFHRLQAHALAGGLGHHLQADALIGL